MSSLVDIGIELAKCPKPPVSLVGIDSVFEESPDFFEKYRETLNERLNNYHIDNSRDFEEERVIREQQISQEISQEIEKFNNSPIIENNDVNNQDRILVYTDNQVFDLPDIINLEDSENYAMIGMSRGDSFLSSILYILDFNYRLETKNQRKNTLHQKKIDMAVKIGDYFRRLSELKKYKTDRIGIKTKLMDDVDTDIEPSLQLLISRHFGINIMIIDLDSKTCQFSGDFNPEIETAILVWDNVMNVYLPIFSIKTKSTFNAEQVKELEDDYVINYPKEKKTKSKYKSLDRVENEEKNDILKEIESSSSEEDTKEDNLIKQFMMAKKAENDEKAKLKAKREAIKQQKKEIKEKKKGQSRFVKEGNILTAKHVDLEKVSLEQLLPMTRYPLDRLQAIAGQLGVKTKEQDIKKPKKELYTEIEAKIKEIERLRQEEN